MIKFNDSCAGCMGFEYCSDWMAKELKTKEFSCRGRYYANKEQVEGLLADWDYRRGKIKPKCKDDKMSEEQTRTKVGMCTATDWDYRRGKIKPKKEYDMSEQQTKYDPKSTHYNSGGIETLDYIKAKLTLDQFQGFCMGNVLKYTSRANTKGNFKRDMEKAAYYSKWAAQEDSNK